MPTIFREHNNPVKNYVRRHVMADIKPSDKNILLMPGAECLDLRMLEDIKTAKPEHLALIERDEDAMYCVEGYLEESRFDPIAATAPSMGLYALNECYKLGELPKLDWAWFDFCGNLTTSIVEDMSPLVVGKGFSDHATVWGTFSTRIRNVKTNLVEEALSESEEEIDDLVKNLDVEFDQEEQDHLRWRIAHAYAWRSIFCADWLPELTEMFVYYTGGRATPMVTFKLEFGAKANSNFKIHPWITPKSLADYETNAPVVRPKCFNAAEWAWHPSNINSTRENKIRRGIVTRDNYSQFGLSQQDWAWHHDNPRGQAWRRK